VRSSRRAKLRSVCPRQRSRTRRGKEINDARSYENQTISKGPGGRRNQQGTPARRSARVVEFVAAESSGSPTTFPPGPGRRMHELFPAGQSETLRTIFTNAQEKPSRRTAAPGRDARLAPMAANLPNHACRNRQAKRPLSNDWKTAMMSS